MLRDPGLPIMSGMKRSGGIAGRPLGHIDITELERVVREANGNGDELTLAIDELGRRKSRRAKQLRDLAQRLLTNVYVPPEHLNTEQRQDDPSIRDV